jgi:hypothetical protein
LTQSGPIFQTSRLSPPPGKVLADAREPMNCKAMIEAMAAKGLWTSPGGATPHATLYSAIAREINEKGNDARFVKVERGQFAAKK